MLWQRRLSLILSAGALLTLAPSVTNAQIIPPPPSYKDGYTKAAPNDKPLPLPSQPAPAGAIVLFDGKLDNWQNLEGKPASWKLLPSPANPKDAPFKDRKAPVAMQVGGGDIRTKRDDFKDYRLHVEFNLPNMPDKTGQARANSGVYMLGRYEVQVLDSSPLAIGYRAPKSDECGGIYSATPPRVNACLPPTYWQTYDIEFRAPRMTADGKVLEKAKVWVWLNGVKIQDGVEVSGGTRSGLGSDNVATGPILLQDHGNPVLYRNIWIQPY